MDDDLVLFLDDFFEEEDILTLLNKSEEELLKRKPIIDKDTNGSLDNELEIYRVDPTMGRCLIEIFDITKDIEDRLSNMINSKFGKYYFSSATYCEYNLKYGNPSLIKHKDSSDDVICIDYQLASNVEWPIDMDGELVTLNDNQALIFNSGKVLHGRVPQDFNDGQYVKMVFFFFKKQKEVALIENLFTQEEIKEINKSLEVEINSRKEIDYHQSYHYEGDDSSKFLRLHKDIGRRIAEYLIIPNSIIEKLNNLVKEFYPDYKYVYSTFCEYNLDYGNPSLPPHFDEARSSYLLIDYQLDANVSWPLVVEQFPKTMESFNLKNNSAHLIFPKRELHGRINMDFNKGEYVKMIFFYFGKEESNV